MERTARSHATMANILLFMTDSFTIIAPGGWHNPFVPRYDPECNWVISENEKLQISEHLNNMRSFMPLSMKILVSKVGFFGHMKIAAPKRLF